MSENREPPHDADKCSFGEACSKHPPLWFKIGEPMIWPCLQAVLSVLSTRRTGNLNLDHIPKCAAIHLIHCMEASIEINRRGRHAVAIGLVRQCVESLTLIDIGLQSLSLRDQLLEAWREEKKSHGQIRMELEREAWPRYGGGLWTETWAEFFGEFARAVQPYAHYTQLLQGWQFASPPGQQLTRSSEGNFLFIAQIGLNTYDGLKASRITLLHCLIAWAVARIMVANGYDGAINTKQIELLGNEMGKSEFLSRGALKWHQEFWPFMFDSPKSESADHPG